MLPTDPRHARILIQLEYIESPRLRLTLAQVSRLCALPREVCSDALTSLVVTGFLSQTHDGSFVRGSLGTMETSLSANRPASRRITAVPLKLMNGQPARSPFWQTLVHFANHGSYHRAQVTTLLRQLGAPPPKSMDMITFCRMER